MKNAILLIITSFIFYSCTQNSEVKTAGTEKVVEDKDNNEYKDPMGYYKPINKDAKYVATSQGSINGKIILNSKVPFTSAMEYDSNKVLLTSILSTGKTRIITHFTPDGKELKFTNHEAGKLNVAQENTYNARGDLLEEYRLDRNETQYDTTVYKYLYKYKKGSKDYTMTRTNNGEPVTHYKVKHRGNKIFKREEAHPNKHFSLVRNYETTVDEAGHPLEILETSISKGLGSSKPDTIISKTIYQYNEAGLVVSEVNTNPGLRPAKALTKYKDGMISERRVGSQLIKFYPIEIRDR